MASRRMISKSISVSRQVNALDAKHALLFTWMIPHADDWGRMPGDPAVVRALVIPMRTDFEVADVEEALQAMHDLGLIVLYQDESGEDYISFPQWEKHQTGLHKRRPSRFPEPPADSRKFPEIPG